LILKRNYWEKTIVLSNVSLHFVKSYISLAIKYHTSLLWWW